MSVTSRCRFDHEEGDPARMTAQLDDCKSMGLELGANVTVWYCPACDVAQVFFEYRNAES